MLVKIEELARFLSAGTHSASEIGRELTENTLKDFVLLAVYFYRADIDGKLRYAGGHNVLSVELDNWKEFDLDVPLPITECVRNRQKIWLNGNEEWELQYPKFKEIWLPPELKTIIDVPLQVEGHPIAAVSFNCQENVPHSAAASSFINAVCGLVGIYAQNLPEFRAARQQGTSRRVLSRRQNNILNLIREKLTNREIGDELGYSESTIRQETMRIYQILHVNNRREAAAFKFIED